jgi:hypothetical protein
MDIPVRIPGMEGQNIALRPAGAITGAKLMLNGQPVAKEKGFYQLRSNAGANVAVKLKGRLLDPIPNLVVGGQTIEVAPALTWAQYAWMSIPIVLVFIGGGIGGLCAGLAATASSRVFRSDLSDGLKYAVTGMISLGAYLTYFVAAGAIVTALHQH